MNCCDQAGNQIDAHLIKCGHWVDVSGSTSINENTDGTAGVYLNPNWVRFQWYGPEISSGPSAEQAFQGAPASSYAMPAGASATPLGRGAPPAQGGFGTTPGGGFGGQAQIGFGGPQPGQGAQPAPGPGFAQQPQPQPQPQPAFNPNVQPVQGGPTAEQVAQHYRVQHHPGWRWNPVTNAYDQDQPAPASAPAAQAGGFGGPALSGGPGGFQGTASPSNAYPGATPHTGFGT